MAIARPDVRFDGTIVTLGTAQATIYQPPLSAMGPIVCITVYNKTATDKTYDLILTRGGVSIHLSPLNHAIPGYSIWTYTEPEIGHHLVGGIPDKLEGYASSAASVDVCVSCRQLELAP